MQCQIYCLQMAGKRKILWDVDKAKCPINSCQSTRKDKKISSPIVEEDKNSPKLLLTKKQRGLYLSLFVTILILSGNLEYWLYN